MSPSLCYLIDKWLANGNYELYVIHQRLKCEICMIVADDIASNRRYVGHINSAQVILYDDEDWAAEHELHAADPRFFKLLEERLSYARPS